jgi:hypothetical protein
LSQSFLFIPLHLLGLVLCFAIGPQQRPALCCSLAFPVGLAATVLLVLTMMLVGIPYVPSTLVIAMALCAIGASIMVVRRGIGRRDLAFATRWTVAFAVICTALTHSNIANLTSIDSHRILSLAIMIANDGGLQSGTLVKLGPWGVFQVVAHSMMGITRRDFLYSLPLVLGLSFIPIFALTLWHALDSLGAAVRRRSWLVGLVTAALFTVGSLDFHLFYIHTNLGAAIYLFLFVVMFWIAEIDRDASWLPVAFLSLVAFALHRTETPIVALVFLALTVTQSELPRRPITVGVGFFAATITIWYETMATRLDPGGDFLTPARCHMISALVVAFCLWWLASSTRIVRGVNRRMPVFVAAAFALVLGAAFVIKPHHMIDSARVWALNLTTLPLWGQTWFVIAALSVIGLGAAPPRFRTPFIVGLPTYFAFILFLVYFRAPYREGRGDSANRMTIQMLALIMFYLAIKFIPALRDQRSTAHPSAQPEPATR